MSTILSPKLQTLCNFYQFFLLVFFILLLSAIQNPTWHLTITSPYSPPACGFLSLPLPFMTLMV